jgi:hypothetical protein
MRTIPDAKKEWTPEEGDELVGILMDIGWDKESGIMEANIQPLGETHLIRVSPRKNKWLGKEWESTDPEEGDTIRIEYLGESEMWKEKGQKEGRSYDRYDIEVMD